MFSSFALWRKTHEVYIKNFKGGWGPCLASSTETNELYHDILKNK